MTTRTGQSLRRPQHLPTTAFQGMDFPLQQSEYSCNGPCPESSIFWKRAGWNLSLPSPSRQSTRSYALAHIALGSRLSKDGVITLPNLNFDLKVAKSILRGEYPHQSERGSGQRGPSWSPQTSWRRLIIPHRRHPLPEAKGESIEHILYETFTICSSHLKTLIPRNLFRELRLADGGGENSGRSAIPKTNVSEQESSNDRLSLYSILSM